MEFVCESCGRDCRQSLIQIAFTDESRRAPNTYVLKSVVETLNAASASAAAAAALPSPPQTRKVRISSQLTDISPPASIKFLFTVKIWKSGFSCSSCPRAHHPWPASIPRGHSPGNMGPGGTIGCRHCGLGNHMKLLENYLEKQGPIQDFLAEQRHFLGLVFAASGYKKDIATIDSEDAFWIWILLSMPL
ncbi:hypothetical protein T310_4591 [Rasamsonia emersonii CBS 393.64]|uniref:Uncharacterized protein n=1 Tax=Rasamsonia emersonii (strain ATCC 16479 / CBS 393.64 / IMI 116815) TaxID=1408163 RepID=A0A0F4YT08_RASE3|nr:hypothetical protein T310_4591 [Rasamsonia emersonii CBS 393.64]KKA21374.1 hypothetical protein T310_4591 [Rasamsonia emersonii CBS 393.64]